MTGHALITGGAGFIGGNLAARLLRRGRRVVVLDNFSGKGAARNVPWLREMAAPGQLDVICGDLRDRTAVISAVRGAGIIYHLGAQTAVTASVADPRADFECNALGTLNVLEAARAVAPESPIIYASTNKVYGDLAAVGVRQTATRYEFRDCPHGIHEDHPLDLHSPYACSKGAADQYVRDYHRIFGLPTVVFRQSCIYGTRQFGAEDQGWVAWFVIASVTGRPITIYGDGKQIRDLLWVDDLLDAYDAAAERIDSCKGQIYNMGGGPAFSVSVWREFGPLLEQRLGRPVPARFGPWRPGDQPIFIADTRKAQRDLDWRPKVTPDQGIARLVDWVLSSRGLF